MKEIPLTRGLAAIVDDEDYTWLSQFKWHADKMRNGNFRAARTVRINGKPTTQFMHRLILQVPEGYVVDHINNNPLDNRRENLRICTIAENSRNKYNVQNLKRVSRRSRFKGVCWDKERNRWCASIMVNGKYIKLGRFDSELEAALAYDVAAIEYFKEYARPNFSRDGVVGIWDINMSKNSNNYFQKMSGKFLEDQII